MPTAHPEEHTADSSHSKSSLETADTAVNASDSEPIEVEFVGDVKTDNKLPSLKTLKKIENLPVLDQDGKAIPFKNLYTGPNVARRVLIIFIRHFFCGNCQEYIRTLTSSISTSSLLSLPTPTFIAIIGHGDPSLIPMYQRETSCPFPIYADPTKKLYSELGMTRTLNLGSRPEYQRKELFSIMLDGFVQSLKMLRGGRALKGGDYHQVGGEFLFEPVEMESPSPLSSPEEQTKRLGEQGMLEMGAVEEKHVTWCHRMRNTRDHAEIPEVREVLGLGDGEELPKGVNEKRWRAALLVRKGTGLSTVSTEGRPSVGLSRKLQELEDDGAGLKTRA
ncbi:uncharacterized protein LY89DRAFT_583519 [Mollisia scopiformis]|uniref:Thioredoxin-like protein AAED1 n=1 Tax=Mollisia scopiformis TaxID=149040 RepID=A0A194XCR1_MOLSC|nr:uncharacterized protein LY89DRAFT_583519 [Mollisia scopiformis]KUJ17941.1 hypothetical protein LY89DRAFT_583519 [Mollisia scopiformis]